MRVREIWRFPVKSMGGEQLESAEAVETGLVGDRAFALFETTTGFGLTARRVPELLFASASLRADGSARITLPDGREAADDAALSEWLGRPVTLRAADEPGSRQYENPADFEDEQGSWEPFDGSRGAFHDTARATVSLLSLATIGSWDLRRFRANLITDGEGEDDLVGRQVAIGAARLDLRMRIARCVMVTRPQPDGIDKDLDVLRRVHRERGGDLAVGGLVSTAGRLAVGDEVQTPPA
ncbi:MAG: MOSC N-terminal beta barrel domain-containing protein [Geodermatophilaceae bacterium]|nr:MOSC N-terminal beta barrel domain-containing protein [Geodermatophilaceae bacterium]